LIVTEAMKKSGWKLVGDMWHAPAAPAGVVEEVRKTTQLQIVRAYQGLGLSEAEARIAAGIERRSLNDGDLFDCVRKP
jgi:hypothetical protein